jgi:DNA-binding NarL/FixJ family response regulator
VVNSRTLRPELKPDRSALARQLVAKQISVRDYLRALPPEQEARGTVRLLESVFGYSTHLSPAQERILIAAANGLTDSEIAAELGLASSSVTAQLKAIYLRLGARNRAHAVLLGTRRGIVG